MYWHTKIELNKDDGEVKWKWGGKFYTILNNRLAKNVIRHGVWGEFSNSLRSIINHLLHHFFFLFLIKYWSLFSLNYTNPKIIYACCFLQIFPQSTLIGYLTDWLYFNWCSKKTKFLLSLLPFRHYCNCPPFWRERHLCALAEKNGKMH